MRQDVFSLFSLLPCALQGLGDVERRVVVVQCKVGAGSRPLGRSVVCR